MRKFWWWLLGALGFVAVAFLAVSFFIDKPLRSYMEQKLNSSLKGYTVHLGAAHFHILGFSLDLQDLLIRQEVNPDPPVAYIPKLSASVQWKALLFARLVADCELDRPAIYINRQQTQKELEDRTPVKERGWQEALESIYPLKINEFRVHNGSVLYQEKGFRPLYLSQVHFRAANIRNIRVPNNVYPSELHLDGQVFAAGRMQLDGRANFLAEPYLGLNVQLVLDNIELDYFQPLVSRRNVTLKGGLLSGAGHMEYAPNVKTITLEKVTMQELQLTYTHTASSTPVEKKAAQKAVQAAQKVNNNPGMALRADQINIVKSTFAFENNETLPHYRLFLTDTEFHLTNFTNHLTEGTTVGKLTGKFMGSGASTVGITFRPEKQGPDFDLAVRIEPTPMRAMNDLWRAYGNFDVVAGSFSFYTELKVENNAISGYVKPLFQDVDVYNSRQDKDKGFFHKIYEGLLGGISWLLENQPNEQVATVTTVSGRLENPQTNIWNTLVGLIQNAFFKAILPGFEKTIGAPVRDEKSQQTQAIVETTKAPKKQ